MWCAPSPLEGDHGVVVPRHRVEHLHVVGAAWPAAVRAALGPVRTGRRACNRAEKLVVLQTIHWFHNRFSQL